jgi:hypothetical protein
MSSPSPQKELELRCFCHRHPLLAVAGRDDNGEGYVHVKTWKGGRLYAEVILTAGTAMVRCRECYRWHRFRIVRTEVVSEPSELPRTISV